MAKPRLLSIVCCLCLLTAFSGAIAGARELPSNFEPRLDRELVQVVNPLDGTTWAAWTFTDGAQTDIALSRRDTDGVWSEPIRVGLDDGEDQAQPALAVDEWGTTYLAYAEAGSGRVFTMAKGNDALDWTSAVAISAPGVRASAPSAMIAASRKLVIGFIADGRVALREMGLLPPMITGFGTDGPDVFGHSPWSPEDEDDDEEQNDGLIDDEGFDADVEFTGPSRRGRSRK